MQIRSSKVDEAQHGAINWTAQSYPCLNVMWPKRKREPPHGFIEVNGLSRDVRWSHHVFNGQSSMPIGPINAKQGISRQVTAECVVCLPMATH